MKRNHQIILLVVSVVVVFAPSLWGEICLVDDFEMYQWLKNGMKFDLVGLFLPGTQSAGYYRPLIGLTYFFDKYVWQGNTWLMHLDNLFFHVVNTYLVFRFAEELLTFLRRNYRYLPLVASLLFGLHPIATESVAWISGRTDILAATFVLLSSRCLVQFKMTNNKSKLLFAIVFTFCGILAKESALAFLPAGLLLLAARTTGNDGENGKILRFNPIAYFLFTSVAIVLLIFTYSVVPVLVVVAGYLLFLEYSEMRHQSAKNPNMRLLGRAGMFLVGAFLPMVLFYGIRKTVFASDVSKISETIKLIFGDLNYTCMVFLGAVGFYVKKFLLPFPLAFAIREIDPLYQFLGVAVVFALLYCLKKRDNLSLLLVSGVLLFSPALLLAFGTIAWTAYAERYIYLSLPFWGIAFCFINAEIILKLEMRKLATATIVMVIALAGSVSFQRSLVWKSNVSLFRDSVDKAPRFRELRKIYMAALMNAGDYTEARKQYQTATTLPVLGYDYDLDLSFVELLTAEGKVSDVEKMYDHIIKKTNYKNAHVLNLYIDHLAKRFATEDIPENKIVLVDRLAKQRDLLFLLDKDPYLLYYTGKAYLSVNHRGNAAYYFRKASLVFDDGEIYKTFATKLAHSLISVTYGREHLEQFTVPLKMGSIECRFSQPTVPEDHS